MVLIGDVGYCGFFLGDLHHQSCAEGKAIAEALVADQLIAVFVVVVLDDGLRKCQVATKASVSTHKCLMRFIKKLPS